MNTSCDYYIFWMQSPKGSNAKRCYRFKKKTDISRIQEALDEWIRAWSHLEFFSYGFKKVKMLPRKDLIKKYDKVCIRQRKIKEEWGILAEMLSPSTRFE